MTASKLSAELTSIVHDKLEIGSEEPINVKVILEEDAILEKVIPEMEVKGLKIKNVQEGPDVVITGTLEVRNVPAINSVSEVDKVEYDRST
ncbi:hypothetical protein SDC9_134520 [bioreactor metagenome]|uniref:Uncharacterized protein n=1 Tax=bioreactor metagenome TaxID=1076179 RepID=A0A645DDE2_9ZZZZ